MLRTEPAHSNTGSSEFQKKQQEAEEEFKRNPLAYALARLEQGGVDLMAEQELSNLWEELRKAIQDDDPVAPRRNRHSITGTLIRIMAATRENVQREIADDMLDACRRAVDECIESGRRTKNLDLLEKPYSRGPFAPH